MTAALHDFARNVLGAYTDQETHEPTGRRRVLHLTDGDGRSWYCKQTGLRLQWRAEVRAYRRWFAAAAGDVPQLRAADRPRRLLMVSALPGQIVDEPGPEVHQAAGALLRRLHDAWPTRREPHAKRAQMTKRLDRELWSAGGDFSSAEEDFVREHMRGFRELPLLEEVACHGDYGPHNWLVDEAGSVRAIDFAESKWNPVPFDLARLCLQSWWDKPTHSAAFFAGYGRVLTDIEHEYLRHQVVRSAVAAIQWGRRHDAHHVETRARSRLSDLMNGHLFDLRDGAGFSSTMRSVARRVLTRRSPADGAATRS